MFPTHHGLCKVVLAPWTMTSCNQCLPGFPITSLRKTLMSQLSKPIIPTTPFSTSILNHEPQMSNAAMRMLLLTQLSPVFLLLMVVRSTQKYLSAWHLYSLTFILSRIYLCCPASSLITSLIMVHIHAFIATVQRWKKWASTSRISSAYMAWDPNPNFTFYQPVYYHMDDTPFPLDCHKYCDHWVAVSETVSNFMTFKIITNDIENIIHCSNIHSACDSSSWNLCMDPINALSLCHLYPLLVIWIIQMRTFKRYFLMQFFSQLYT